MESSCTVCYQPAAQLFQVTGFQTPTCAKCSETITRGPQAPQQFYQSQPPAPISSQINQAMPPPPLHIPTPNDQQQLGAQIAHHKKFTATTASHHSNTFELEQALINMDGEVLLEEEGQCPLCQKVFNRKTSLLNHIRNHSADKKYVCNYCQKGFSQQANLRNHERIHTNDRPYVCIDCGKAFTQITNLNNHRRLHTGERPFVCIEMNCGRSFAQVTNLNNHMKTHHKIQQYVCSQCPKKFHTVTQLNHHLGTHGITIKTQIAPRGEYACNLCPTFFNDEAQLKRHIQRHAEGRYFPCTVSGCTEGFSSKNQLNKHLQYQHPNECNRRKESRQVPLSLLQIPGNFSPNKTKIKVEDDAQLQSSLQVTQIPIQIAGHNGTIAINLSSPYHAHPPSFNGEHLLSNGMSSDATKKVLSDHLSNFNHFLNSFTNAPAIPNNSSKFTCNSCYNVFKTIHTLNKHIQKFHS